MNNSKSSIFKSILSRVTGAPGLKVEKARLEAFLAAFPGEYCGFARDDGSVAYSKGFCDILGLESIRTAQEIQNRLSISDAAAFEAVYNRLKQDGIPFTIYVKSSDETQDFKISASRGYDQAGENIFDVLWIEDVTEQLAAQEMHARKEKEDRQTNIQFETILDRLPCPIWVRDQDQKIVWVNRAYIDSLDSTFGDIVLQQQEFVPPAKRRADRKKIPTGPELAKAAVKKGEPQNLKTHIIRGGKRKLTHIHEISVKRKNSGGKDTVGFAEDITALEDMENDLRRYQATNEELLGQLGTAIGIYNAEQELEFFNAAFSQLWGLEDQWLNTGPKLGDVMEKLRELRRLPEQSDFRNFKKSWLDMFTSLIEPYEDMLYLPDGTALRMLVVPQSAGGLMMTFEDVTSRLELESSYNTLIAVQKETLDNLAEGVAVYGGDGRLKLWNPAFGRLWGLHPEDLEGEPHVSKLVEKKKQFFEEKDWPARKDDLIQVTLERSMREGRLERADGVLVEFSAVPLPDGGVLVTFADITDTVRVENALREKNAALEAAEKLKLDFLANVSYQLRTPLSSIMGFNDILAQEYFGPLNTRQKAYTRDIQESGNKLLNLINDILDLSTIEAGYMTLEYKPIRIKDMLESMIDLTTDWAQKEKVKLNLHCPANIGRMEADERRLKQALMNLIRNSITFTPEGGSIDIRAKRKKEGIEIQVQDTGIGIKRETQLRVFQPFERAQRGLAMTAQKGATAGAGLGLSLVKNIVNLHGGTLDLESTPGKGTRVTLWFPFEEKQETKKQKVSISLGQ